MQIGPGDGASVVNKALGTDVLKEIERPGEKRETLVSKKGKIKHLAHNKIMKGDLAAFKNQQTTLVDSVMDAADRLQGREPQHGGNKKLTDKIYKQAVSLIGSDHPEEARVLAQDLKSYANELAKAFVHRRGELKSEHGIFDRDVAQHWGISMEQFSSLMDSQFKELKFVGTVAADIIRYGSQDKITMRASNGEAIPREESENAFELVNTMLQNAMIGLGMGEDGPEPVFNDTAAEILRDFAAKVKDEGGGDKVSPALGQTIRELKESGNPEKKKLAFALYAMSQNWVVQPSRMIGSLAREAYGHDRFRGHAVKTLPDMTRFEIQFEEDGAVTLYASGAHTNKDVAELGEDFTILLTTRARMRPEGSDELQLEYDFTIEHPPGKGTDPHIQRLKGIMTDVGFEVRTRGVDKSEQKKATAANTLIDAIRQKDLSKTGPFRLGGRKNVYEELANNLMVKSHPGDADLHSPSTAAMDREELTSALKYLLREGFPIITGDQTEAYLEIGTRENGDEAVAEMRELISRLPEEKQSVVRNLCQMCHDITDLAEENKMTPNNLAIAMGPSLSPEADPLDHERQISAFEILLEAFPRP